MSDEKVRLMEGFLAVIGCAIVIVIVLTVIGVVGAIIQNL